MKDQLQKLVNENAGVKHMNSLLKSDHELYTWVIKQCENIDGLETTTEKIRYALYNELPICSISNKKKRWINVQEGWRFCGRANICECANKSVSVKVSESKSLTTDRDKKLISARRAATNLSKYGVTNAGQTLISKNKHAEFYKDPALVKQQIDAHKATMQSRYGVDNPLQLDSVKQKVVATIQDRYGVDNFNQLTESKLRISNRTKKTWIARKESAYDYYKLSDKFKTISNVEFVTSASEYKGAVGCVYYKFKCITCNNDFETWISAGHLPICKKCFPTIPVYKSGEENQVFEYIQSLGVNAEQRNRMLINPYELDIICHDKHIAIEYCGLYWHSESKQGKLKDYHINKMKLCAEKGYRLITIFSDEWQHNQNIVKAKLASIFKSSNRIYARKCLLVNVLNSDANQFYKNHHLQGPVKSKIHIGLTFDNTLVACMSFSTARAFTNNKKQDGVYELLRYASSTPVTGGASKILREFENRFNPISIYSYADARWSVGNMYTQLGFITKSLPTVPGYWYTQDYSTRHHRFNFTKAALVKQGHDSSLTEWQIMQLLKWDRIWDCGQYKFVKNYT